MNAQRVLAKGSLNCYDLTVNKIKVRLLVNCPTMLFIYQSKSCANFKKTVNYVTLHDLFEFVNRRKPIFFAVIHVGLDKKYPILAF